MYQVLRMVPKREVGLAICTIEWEQYNAVSIDGVKEREVMKPCRTYSQGMEETLKSG